MQSNATVEPGQNVADERLRVVLPDDLASTFFTAVGYQPDFAEDKREFARLQVRRTAQIEFANIPNRYQESAEEEEFTLVKDLSAAGIAVLYHDQIFTGDVFRVYFQRREITAVAVRCRKLGEACFEVGANVLKTLTLEPYETTQSEDSR